MPYSSCPRSFPGVMISSTFTDLKAHREAIVDALRRQELTPISMENDGARADADLISSSIKFVRDSAAYIGVISHKYGQTPVCSKRNPDNLSITELEFNEAIRLNRPILLFIMGDDHPVMARDVELYPEKKQKLNSFRERAKEWDGTSKVARIYDVFDNMAHQDFWWLTRGVFFEGRQT